VVSGYNVDYTPLERRQRVERDRVAGEHILVVDDGRENREFVVEYVLRPNGYRVSVARDGREGLSKALTERPDLILLDQQMPHMTGTEVIKALAAARANIPVILMTFHGSEEIAVEVFRLGVKDYVKKPYTVEEMLAAIERSLTETRLRKEKDALMQRVLVANQELQQRVRELNVLYRMGKNVTAQLELEQLAPRVVDAAVTVTDAEEGTLFLRENDTLVCRAARRATDSRAVAVNVASLDPLARQAVETGRPLTFTPEDLAPLRAGRPGLPYAALVVPLIIKDRVLGALGVNSVSEGGQVFTAHDQALLSALADYAAIAVENAGNFIQLQAAKEREKQQIRQMFERYVAPSVVDRVLDHPEALRLGGKRQVISILFADIRGYSAFSERAEPEQVVEMLNTYFQLAADVIMAREGTLDKFLGDGVMAFFNAPQPQDDHVRRALDAAVALREAVTAWNNRQGQPGLTFGIGVHTGEAVVGNIGAARAMNYTVIGDAVNVAKRLQEYAAPGQILITDRVLAALGDSVRAHSLGMVQAKGRQQPVAVYAVLP